MGAPRACIATPGRDGAQRPPCAGTLSLPPACDSAGLSQVAKLAHFPIPVRSVVLVAHPLLQGPKRDADGGHARANVWRTSSVEPAGGHDQGAWVLAPPCRPVAYSTMSPMAVMISESAAPAIGPLLAGAVCRARTRRRHSQPRVRSVHADRLWRRSRLASRDRRTRVGEIARRSCDGRRAP